jgi:hypothetical protein
LKKNGKRSPNREGENKIPNREVKNKSPNRIRKVNERIKKIQIEKGKNSPNRSWKK